MAFGVDTNDAAAAPFFSNLPLDGNSGSNFPRDTCRSSYPCPVARRDKYTITRHRRLGHKASKSVTITDVNFNN